MSCVFVTDGRALPEVPTTSAGIQAHDDVISVTSSSSNQSTLRSSASGASSSDG